MPITRFPHGLSSFGIPVLGGQYFALPQAGTKGQHRWVDTANGNNSNSGLSPEAPVATITQSLTNADDGVPTVHHVFPGQYAESPDITKRDQMIIGETNAHAGRVQIIGDGTTARATIRVDTGFARGFVLSNVEVDTNLLARPAIHIVSNDAGALTATYNDAWWKLDRVRVNSGNATLPSAALYLEGAIAGEVSDCLFANCTLGVALSASLNLFPDGIQFWNTRYQDNVTADIVTVNRATTAFTAGTSVNMTNVQWFNDQFMDRGGTPVTNYINAAGTMVNVGNYGFFSARDVADATLMQLPVDWIAIGWSAAAAEFIIGA